MIITLSQDGNQVCALYGVNLQEGIAGFGDNIPDALRALANEWERELSPNISNQAEQAKKVSDIFNREGKRQ